MKINYKNELKTNVTINCLSFLIGLIGFLTNKHFFIFIPFIVNIALFFYNLDILHEIAAKEAEEKLLEKEKEVSENN